MSDSDGHIRDDLFIWDGMHMNKKGYGTWIPIIKATLIDAQNAAGKP
jgi:hypothetical protein